MWRWLRVLTFGKSLTPCSKAGAGKNHKKGVFLKNKVVDNVTDSLRDVFSQLETRRLCCERLPKKYN